MVAVSIPLNYIEGQRGKKNKGDVTVFYISEEIEIGECAESRENSSDDNSSEHHSSSWSVGRVM